MPMSEAELLEVNKELVRRNALKAGVIYLQISTLLRVCTQGGAYVGRHGCSAACTRESWSLYPASDRRGL